MTRAIDAVLFDFGGVFTDSPFRVTEAVGDDMGAEPGRMLEIVFGPYHRDTDHPWHRLERGELSFEDARQEISELGRAEGLDIDLIRVLGAIGSSSETRTPMVERVRKLQAAGFRTALVTNNAREFRQIWRAMLPFDELFDVVVDSSEVGMRKPNPQIYLHTLSLLGGVAPERSMFLDDFEANVAAARELGMQGVVVAADPSEALDRLDALLAAGR